MGCCFAADSAAAQLYCSCVLLVLVLVLMFVLCAADVVQLPSLLLRPLLCCFRVQISETVSAMLVAAVEGASFFYSNNCVICESKDVSGHPSQLLWLYR